MVSGDAMYSHRSTHARLHAKSGFSLMSPQRHSLDPPTLAFYQLHHRDVVLVKEDE
jgi:hypothetical protein